LRTSGLIAHIWFVGLCLQAGVDPSEILESVSQSIIAEVDKEDSTALPCMEMLLKDVVQQTTDLLMPS
jgi:hypothetical protein